jgi:hypothetical protein
MAIYCVDIAEDKRLGTSSPFVYFAFLFFFVILTAFLDPGVIYLLLVTTSYFFCYLFFQYEPRYIFLLWRGLFRHHYLSPSFRDEKYIGNHKQFEKLNKIIDSKELY